MRGLFVFTGILGLDQFSPPHFLPYIYCSIYNYTYILNFVKFLNCLLKNLYESISGITQGVDK